MTSASCRWGRATSPSRRATPEPTPESSPTPVAETLPLVPQGAADAIARIAAAELPPGDTPRGALDRATAISRAVTGEYNAYYTWPLQHAEHVQAHAAIVQGLERDSYAREIRRGGHEATALVATAMLDAMTTPNPDPEPEEAPVTTPSPERLAEIRADAAAQARRDMADARARAEAAARRAYLAGPTYCGHAGCPVVAGGQACQYATPTPEGSPMA